VKALAFSPDGKILASGGPEGFVRLWRLDRPEYSRLPGAGTVRGLAFTPDGKSLVSAAEDGRTIVWNLETEKGRELPRAGTVAGLTGLTLDAQGKLLAVCGVGTGPGLWDLETRTPLLRPTVGHHVEVQGVAFSADGATLMSAAEDRTLRLWDLAAGKERKILEGRDPLESVTVSADGKFLAASGKDGFLSFWDVDHDYARNAVHTKNPRSAVAFSPTAALVASALTNGTVELWRPDHFDKPLRTLVAHPDKSSGVMTLAFSPDGKWLATASRGDLQAKVWDVQTGKKLASLPHTLPPSDLVFRADGQALLTADGEGLIRFWQTADWHEGPAFPLGDGPPPNKPPNWGLRLDGSPDGRYLAVASPSRGSIRILDLTSSTVREARSWQLSGRIRDIAFAPDSRHLAIAGSNGLVYVLRCRLLGE
jgi:WD40 repeat protein